MEYEDDVTREFQNFKKESTFSAKLFPLRSLLDRTFERKRGGGGGVSREKIRRIEEKSRNKRRGGRRITFERRKAHETAKKDNGKVF